MYEIEFRLRSGGEWQVTGQEYKKEKAVKIALAAKQDGVHKDTFEYRRKQDAR